MDIQELRKRKKDLKLSYDDIANKSGIPKTTITNILTGRTSNPRIDTLKAIEKTLGIGFTKEELAAGISPTVIRNVDPDEDDLLEAYRELGLKKGKPAQELALKFIEELKNI